MLFSSITLVLEKTYKIPKPKSYAQEWVRGVKIPAEYTQNQVACSQTTKKLVFLSRMVSVERNNVQSLIRRSLAFVCKHRIPKPKDVYTPASVPPSSTIGISLRTTVNIYIFSMYIYVVENIVQTLNITV